ncbi:MAG: hypothetical protein ACKVZH_14740 [Blastocatellia bacterium]
MNRFEDELKQSLRREEPSSDFTDRLMARIALDKEGLGDGVTGRRREAKADWIKKLRAMFTLPQMKWAMAGAMAASLVISVVGVNRYRQHQLELRQQAELAEAEGQRAKEQVMFAMRIASAKLNVAQKKVKESLHNDDQQTGHQ